MLRRTSPSDHGQPCCPHRGVALTLTLILALTLALIQILNPTCIPYRILTFRV